MLARVYVSDRSNVMVSDDLLQTVVSTSNFLGSGVSRQVYDLGDGTVLKINREGSGWAGDCASEAAAWESLKDSDVAQYLAPVLAAASDGTWLVMVKADIGATLPRTADSALYEAGIQDLHCDNVGVLPDGRIVATDYAFNKNPRATSSAPSVGTEDEDEDREDSSCRCTACQFNSHRRFCAQIPAHCDECKFHLETLGRPENQDGTSRTLFCNEHPCSVCNEGCTCDDCFAAVECCIQCDAPAIAMVRDLPIVGRVALCATCDPDIWAPFTNPNKLFRVMGRGISTWFLAGFAFTDIKRI